jgi:hypothetical protein
VNEAKAAPLGLDPGWRGGSLIECGACHQPIAVPRGEAAKCGYCGASFASPTPVPPDAPDGAGDRLLFDLRRSPAGLEDLGERPGKQRLPALRGAWEATKSALAGAHSSADEFRAAWLAATLGRIYGVTGDAVRERAVLEAALSQLVVPAYRATVIARLARAAAFAGHVDLAEEWLSVAPDHVGIAEIDGDVTVARALLLLKRERFAEVLFLLGEDDEGSAFSGLSRPFADLVRIEALERTGRGYAAYALYRKAIKVHGAVPLQGLVMYYRLGVKTRAWILATGFVVILVILALLVACWRLLTYQG